MDRRQFALSATAWCATTSSAMAPNAMAETPEREAPRWRVAVIGHTGRGDYGHGLDTVWLQIPDARIVAVADANDAGRQKELKKLNLDVDAGFADYKQMLRQVQPDVVAICPRYLDQHHDMILAAVDGGARGIYLEKPFVRTPAEADSVKLSCERRGVKLAVAHRNRYHPTLQRLDRMIGDGEIGELLEIRGRGKGDRRGGAEDLWVLGSHVLNLMAYFGGSPLSCSATVFQDGRRVERSDVKEGNEGLGLLAGNELHAMFRMKRGLTAYFDSIANDGTGNHGFGLQLIGSKGVLQIQCDQMPLAHLISGNPFAPTRGPRPWVPVTSAGPGESEPIGDLRERIHGHQDPARDLLTAMDQGEEPICGLEEAAETVEMISAVFESHRLMAEVSLPLASRDHPLSLL